MNNEKNIMRGLMLIVIGVLLLVSKLFNFSFIDWAHLWPLIPLAIGLSFELGYFVSRKDAGILVPGGILTTISFLFLFETFTNWRFSDITWPIYVLAVSIGLYQLYFFGGKRTGVLIPASILAVIFAISASYTFLDTLFPFIDASLALPIILILVGVYLLYRNFSGNRTDNNNKKEL